jgi:hypothetical protein
MKHFIKNTDQHFGIACLLFWLAGLWGFFIPTPAICDNSVADEIISLNVTNQPLGEVLENISIAAGCQFSFDENWDDYPITVSFDNKPLHRGLKRIFRNINNAVIYGADRTIRIIIYDEATFSGKAIRHSTKTNSSQEPNQQIQPSSEATAPQPEPGDTEDSSDAENVDQPPEETTESASESGVADVEITESAKEESGEATAEEKTDDLETVKAEPVIEQESDQTEETESASDRSENSE